MHHEMGGGMGCPVCGGGMGHGMCRCGKGLGGIKMIFKMMPWKVIMHADELGISEEQVEALRSKHIEAMKQMVQIGCQMKLAKIDLKNAVMREEMDMGTAEAKAQEIGKLKGEKIATMIKAMNEMRQTLRPEQRQKIKEMVMGWFKKGGMSGFGGGEEEEQEGETEEEE